jgi:hypothetical protein
MRATKTLPEAHTNTKACELQEEAEMARAEAPLARLEDLHVWELEKTKITKKGSRSYRYRM